MYKKVLLFVAFSGLLIVPMLVGGMIAKALWGWYVVPIFEIAPLTIPRAIGLVLLARIFVPLEGKRVPLSDPEWKIKMIDHQGDVLQGMLWILGYGWLFHFLL